MVLYEERRSSREDGGLRTRSEEERSCVKVSIFMELMRRKE